MHFHIANTPLLTVKKVYLAKPIGITLAFLVGLSALPVMADDTAEMPSPVNAEQSSVGTKADTFNNDQWQDSSSQAFNKLDTSGNGLLLPNEASKGKAFTKKSFKQADTDNDGSIDKNEYVVFKTGKMPDTTSTSATPVIAKPSAKPSSKPMPEVASPATAIPEPETEMNMTDDNH